ncbi:MAG: porin family protein [Cyclobacteriaceae bacterium]|jgi:hypothetical protein
MRKIYITLALLIIGTLSFAGPGLGLKGGANFASQNTSSFLPSVEISTSNITGFVGGAYLNYFFGDKSAIQLELLYSQKGSVSEIIQGGSSVQSNDNKLTYFDIPVLFRWQIIKFLNIHAGPQFSILTKAVTEDGTTSEDIKDELKNSDFGLIIGAEANLPLRLNLTARYIYGLSNVSEIEDIEIKNSTFQLTLGIRLIGN